MQYNILPCDGDALYYRDFYDSEKADYYMQTLLKEIDWKNDQAKIFGRHIITKRKVAWYAEQEYIYGYSKIERRALLFNSVLQEMRNYLQEYTGYIFNSCLLNLYHDGNEGMGWHSDDEPQMGKFPVIASISLGAERRFLFRHKHKELKAGILLQHGSLLLMAGQSQQCWQHSVPKAALITQPRINLTWRQYQPGVV